MATNLAPVMRVRSVMRALVRHPDQGPYGELASIFYNVPGSNVRDDAARAMAATDPASAQTHASECRRDCEPEVRTLGRTNVEFGAPGVRSRVQATASDWAEVPETQLSAQSGLQGQ